MSLVEEILSQLPGDVLNRLRNGDRVLENLRKGSAPVPSLVRENQHPLESVDWDVVICGGTLGILIGCTLVMQGLRVALLERGILKGREQEWNISRQELDIFLDLGLLSADELNKTIVTEYNPARVSFFEGTEVWVENVLNIGVDPVYLLETLKNKFLDNGGKLFENTAFEGATVHPNGVVVNDSLADSLPKKPSNKLSTKLLIDAMGHFSPIAKQARQGKKPDAICLVVGTCAEGFPENDTGDLLVSFTPLKNQCQYFWEAFPAKDGRTTYMFTYMDADPQRLSLEAFFEDYLKLMPEYQNVELSQLDFKRALFGFFPSYRESPLKTPWRGILPVGDSSGNQSPLSFGGFGAMIRHLPRLNQGIKEALESDNLSARSLGLLQPYQPSLSVTWLFQKSMSVGINQKIADNQINNLLSIVFAQMQNLGDSVLKPFLQDVVQFGGLTKTLALTSLKNPLIITTILPQVGLFSIIDWMVHYINLGIYSGLFKISQRIDKFKNKSNSSNSSNNKSSEKNKYYWNRWVDAWKYGSGGDYQ